MLFTDEAWSLLLAFISSPKSMCCSPMKLKLNCAGEVRPSCLPFDASVDGLDTSQQSEQHSGVVVRNNWASICSDTQSSQAQPIFFDYSAGQKCSFDRWYRSVYSSIKLNMLPELNLGTSSIQGETCQILLAMDHNFCSWRALLAGSSKASMYRVSHMVCCNCDAMFCDMHHAES